MNTKISSASKYDQQIIDAPASVTLISSDEIKRFSWQTVGEAVNSVRGFFQNFDMDYTFMGTRGFLRPASYSCGIIVLINGHQMSDNYYGQVYYENELNISVDIIDKIEIVRGPGAALYGSGALFGVINIITKDGMKINGARLSSKVGSMETISTSFKYGREFDNGLNVTFSSEIANISGSDQYFKEFDKPKTNYGVTNKLDWEKYHGFYLNAVYKGFNFHSYYNSRSHGIPTASWGMLFNDKAAQNTDVRNFTELLWKGKLTPSLDLNAKVSFDKYYYTGTYPYSPLTAFDSLQGHYLTFDDSKGIWFGSEINFNWDILPSNRASLILSFTDNVESSYKSWDRTSSNYYNVPFNIYSIYISDAWQLLENLNIMAGLRYDDYLEIVNHFSPRFALLFNPFEKSVIKLLYSQSFRAPSIYEETSFNPKFHLGDLSLKPELIKSCELAYEQSFLKYYYGSFSIFYNRLNDFIDLTQVGSDSLNMPIYSYRNVNKMTSYGVEMDLFAKFPFGLITYTNFAYTDSRNDSDKIKIDYYPDLIFKFGASQFIWESFLMSAEFRYESPRLCLDYTTKSKSIIQTDFTFAYKPNLKGTGANANFINNTEFSLIIKNLLDNKMSLPADPNMQQILLSQYGRRWYLKITFTI
ncbi:MAG: TonB-dependent receptor [Candidatus Kapabacteria bacterium]|nr:TonB-dependent receptor [Candidatus Kapabacteria bacterium]